MSQSALATNIALSADLASDVSLPGPRGRWLLVARCVWLLLAGGLLVDVILCIPTLYRLQHTICTRSLAECSSLTLPTLDTLRALHHLGLSLPTYAIYATIVALALPVGYCSVGALIFWRKSTEWLGLFVSFTLVLFGSLASILSCTGSRSFSTLRRTYSGSMVIVENSSSSRAA